MSAVFGEAEWAVRAPVRRRPRWLPLRERTAIEEFGVQGRPVRFALGLGLMWSVFAFGPVARVTGVSPPEAFAVWAVLSAWFMIAHWLLYRLAATSTRAFYALVLGNVLVGGTVALSMPVLAHRPSTPLWLGFSMMACIVGASETEGSLLLGLFFALAPFATIPFFRARGCSFSESTSCAAVTAAGSAYGYWFMTRRREHWRRDRHQLEMELARERLAASEADRARLSRDLHDTVGTTLSLVALYGSLVEHRADDVVEARKLAGTIRQAARDALHELRGLLQSLPQGPARLEDIALGLALVAGRAAEPTGAVLTVGVSDGGDTVMAGALRTTIVRIFQEAVHNALHHGRANRIAATFSADAARVDLVVSDDGGGFDLGAARAGTGIAGMQARARELGGELTVESAPGGGTSVRLRVPVTGA